jgi:hypothetical protein
MVLFLALAPLAFSGTLNLSTGLDTSGNVITTDHGCDAHWVQTVGPALACAGGASTGPAQVVLPSDPDSLGSNDSNSAWITSDASTTQNGSPLPTYKVTFYITSTTSASLSGSWSSDDGGTIMLNGMVLGTRSGASYNNPVSDSNSLDFLIGANTLTIQMIDSDNFHEGVRFNGSLTAEGASFSRSGGVPEPSSVLLLLLGAGGLVLRRRLI